MVLNNERFSFETDIINKNLFAQNSKKTFFKSFFPIYYYFYCLHLTVQGKKKCPNSIQIAISMIFSYSHLIQPPNEQNRKIKCYLKSLWNQIDLFALTFFLFYPSKYYFTNYWFCAWLKTLKLSKCCIFGRCYHNDVLSITDEDANDWIIWNLTIYTRQRQQLKISNIHKKKHECLINEYYRQITNTSNRSLSSYTHRYCTNPWCICMATNTLTTSAGIKMYGVQNVLEYWVSSFCVALLHWQ